MIIDKELYNKILGVNPVKDWVCYGYDTDGNKVMIKQLSDGTWDLYEN